jgi:hypothetical protein
MKIKKEYLILVLIIVALSIYLFTRKEDRTFYELPVLPEISKKEITKIEISKGDTSIILNKKDEKWYIGPHEYAADTSLVNAMLDECEELRLTTLVSESRDYLRYDLVDEKKINVKAWQADSLQRNFDVGKPASSFGHTFVKLANDERVFHARNNFRSKFDKTVDNLRDKAVLSFQTADINELQITKDQASLTLTRTEVPDENTATKSEKTNTAASQPVKTVWQSTDGKMGDDKNLNRLLSALSNLRCDAFIEDRKKEDFSSPVYSVNLKGIQTYNLSIFAKLKEDDSHYPAISSGSNYAFLLSINTANRIMKNPQDLIEKPKTDESKSEAEKPEPKQQKQ